MSTSEDYHKPHPVQLSTYRNVNWALSYHGQIYGLLCNARLFRKCSCPIYRAVEVLQRRENETQIVLNHFNHVPDMCGFM